MVRDLKSPERKLVTVLHLDWPNAPTELLLRATSKGSVDAVVELYNMGLYRKATTVLCNSLDQAFHLTEGATPIGDGAERGLRPTSVGDILVWDDQEPFAIAKLGFEPLPILLSANHHAKD